VVHHHVSTLRFYHHRYAGDPRLLLSPLVAAVLTARGLASLARAWRRTHR